MQRSFRTPTTPWHAAAVADDRARSESSGRAWGSNHARGHGILECFYVVRLVTAEAS
jgi:hypothetical protein